MSADACTLAGLVTGTIPGSPGGVRAIADTWRQHAGTARSGASLTTSAHTATWQGQAATAFATAASDLSQDLGTTASKLDDGATALYSYATVLEAAQQALDQLTIDLSTILNQVLDTPAAPAALGVIHTAAAAATSLRAEVTLAATQAATKLLSHQPDDHSAKRPRTGFETTPLSETDIRVLQGQADAKGGGWQDVNQGLLGDSYLMALLQAYSQTRQGRQYLRDHVAWDEDQQGFVVTLYDEGKPVDVLVTDYYSYGGGQTNGKPSLISLYERAYGLHFGQSDLDKGAWRDERGRVMLTPEIVDFVETTDAPGWLGRVTDDHIYSENDWNELIEASRSGKTLVAETSSAVTGHDVVTAVTDTNDNGTIDSNDQTRQVRIAGGDYRGHGWDTTHVYTVVSVTSSEVVLRNPWGYNDLADNKGTTNNGLIRISREDYERYFGRTDIGLTP